MKLVAGLDLYTVYLDKIASTGSITVPSPYELEKMKKIKLFSRKKDKFFKFKANNIYVRIIFFGR